MPVTVDTPLCVADQATFMTVVRKHKPREGGREGGREDARGAEEAEKWREVDCKCAVPDKVHKLCQREKKTTSARI